MHVFSKTTNRTKISILREIPTHIEYGSGTPSIASFSDGSTCPLGCIGCTNPRCMRFSPEDIMCDEVGNFPHDQSVEVCAVGAIHWDAESDTPIIDSDKCIKCGICMRRCPVGAIYFDGNVKINRTLSQKEICGTADRAISNYQARQIEELEDIPRSGTLIMESDTLFEEIYEKLSNIRSNYHNIVARNLLISLGCRCAMRRIGDVYTRMDAVYSSGDESFGAVEVEFGHDTLDASRGILDDIAVLYTRYGIDKDANLPLVVCLQLPNARQGYWQVVKDINTVEEIPIATLTIGAMMILNWNGSWFLPDDVTYHLDYDNMDLRSAITWQIQRSPQISNKLLGILEPNK